MKLDSFAWVAYFKGSERGKKIKTLIDGSEPLYTPSICLTEVKTRYLRPEGPSSHTKLHH